MHRPALLRGAYVTALLILTASCSAGRLPSEPKLEGHVIPPPGWKALCEQSQKEEKRLLAEVKLYEDPLLESYLEGVAARLVGRGAISRLGGEYRIRVIEDPALNAFNLPHGSIYLHTGLLARMENEDQIATILGHEMTHVENWHALRQRQWEASRKRRFNLATMVGSALLSWVGHGYEGTGSEEIPSYMGYISSISFGAIAAASSNGYIRNLEREADWGGFAKVAVAGYDLREAAKLYQKLLNDYGDQSAREIFFFGRHPQLADRLESVLQYQSTHPASRTAGEAKVGDPEGFARCMPRLVETDARLNLDRGQLQLAEDHLKRLRQWMPEDPGVLFLQGRLRLAQARMETDAQVRDALRAAGRDWLQRAFRLDPQYVCAEVHEYRRLALEPYNPSRAVTLSLILDALRNPGQEDPCREAEGPALSD